MNSNQSNEPRRLRNQVNVLKRAVERRVERIKDDLEDIRLLTETGDPRLLEAKAVDDVAAFLDATAERYRRLARELRGPVAP